MLCFFMSCKSTQQTNQKQMTEAEKVLMQTVEAHGGVRYNTAHYEFVFRKNKYSFKNDKNGFEYTTWKSKEGQEIVDKLTNNGFIRSIDGKVVTLSEKEKDRYGSSLNSVIYFATLPHKLLDPAVNLIYKGETKIKGEDYKILQISFDEVGGGKDHEDIYHYWINQKTNLIDYLAYNFKVNNGGARFRSAYNTRKVNGVVFQDYVNYKAPYEIPLTELPALFEKDKLKKLSLIETESVKQL